MHDTVNCVLSSHLSQNQFPSENADYDNANDDDKNNIDGDYQVLENVMMWDDVND